MKEENKKLKKEVTLEYIADLIGGLAESLDNLKIEVQDIKVQLKTLEIKIEKLENRVTALENRVAGIENRLAGLENRVTGLENIVINGFKKNEFNHMGIFKILDRLQVEQDSTLRNYDQRLSALEANLHI